MSEILKGSITINRRLLEHAVWQREPACYGRAWVDLIALANDAPRTTFIHAEAIPLARGQLCWSQRALEKRWQRSDLWVRSFLKFCVDATMILVDANRRRTIITILNYEVYNPPKNDTLSDTDHGTGLDTDFDTDHGTGLDTDLEQKGESGKGKGKGEGKPPETQGFAEVPAEDEVLTFGREYLGDLSRGIPPGMPERWARDWFRYKVGSGHWPKKWREKMAVDFRDDWTAGHPKARSGREKKNGGGRSPAQTRFELGRELEEIQARLDALHEVGAEPSRADKAREKELKKIIKELPE